MTMHLMRGLTTTSTRKRTVKMTRRKQADLAHINFLRKKEGLAPLTSLVAPKAPKARFIPMPVKRTAPVRCLREGADLSHIPSLPFTGETCGRPADKVYTGDKMIGIGTLHKSNAVPVFSSDDAKDIAKMRR